MNKLNFVKQKIKIGDHIIKNRIVSSPISTNMAETDGTVNDNIVSYFSNLAKNQIGMVTVGATSVSKEGGDAMNGMHIGGQNHEKGLIRLAKSINENDSIAAIQIFHVGAQGNTNYSKQRIVGPSKYVVPDIGIEAEVLSIDEIEIIEDEFVQGIIQAFDCGFKLVELHLGHGYLLHEFMSSHMNKRNDIYGGSKINRLRIVTNILAKLRSKSKNITKNMGARISANDFIKGGLSLIENKELIKILDDNNFCYYSVTAGIYESAKQKYLEMKEGSYWEYAYNLKKMTKTPVIAQGNITTLEMGEILLKKNMCDLFGMAQALIADPALAKKTLNNQTDQVIPCLAHLKVGSCHRCRYVKQKDLTFDCITPSSWHRTYLASDEYNKKKEEAFWKMLNKLKKDISGEKLANIEKIQKQFVTKF